MNATLQPTNAMIAAHEAGYEANCDGILLRDNPHAEGTDEHRAWESGHLQAQDARDEWEQCNHERAKRYP